MAGDFDSIRCPSEIVGRGLNLRGEESWEFNDFIQPI